MQASDAVHQQLGCAFDHQRRPGGDRQLRRAAVVIADVSVEIVAELFFQQIVKLRVARRGIGDVLLVVAVETVGPDGKALHDDRRIVRHDERHALRDRVFLVEDRLDGPVDQEILAVFLLEEDRDAAAVLAVDRAVRQQVERGAGAHLDMIQQQDTRADEIEIAVDGEGRDPVEARGLDRQRAAGGADARRVGVAAQDQTAVLIDPAAAAAALRRRKARALDGDAPACLRGIAGAVEHRVLRGELRIRAADLLIRGGGLFGRVRARRGSLRGSLVLRRIRLLTGRIRRFGRVRGRFGRVCRRFGRVRGRLGRIRRFGRRGHIRRVRRRPGRGVAYDLRGRLERELLFVAVGPDSAVERDGEQRRAQRAADSFAFLIHRFSVLSFKGDAGAAEAYPLSAICSSSAS